MRRRVPNTGGYSLVELIAALTIFSMGVLGALSLFTTCLESTSSSLSYSQAVLLAQAALEESIAEGDLMEGTSDGDFGDDYPRHSWEREVLDTERVGLQEVRLTVMWNERGVDKEYTLTTLVAERGGSSL